MTTITTRKNTQKKIQVPAKKREPQLSTMKVINLEQSSDDWRKWRLSGIGSSDISAIIGISPYKTAWDVYEEKTTGVEKNYENPYMMRGKMYEEKVRESFNKTMGKNYKPICVQHAHYPYIIASLDGYCANNNESIEIKVPGKKNWEKAQEGIILNHYQAQMQWQMMITGHVYMYYVVYSVDSKDMIYIKCEADKKYQQYLKQEAQIFWDNLQKKIKPPMQNKDYIYIEGLEARLLDEEYVIIHQEIKERQDRLKALKSQILELGDGGNFRTPRLTVYWKEGRDTLDKEKMEKDGIDLTPYLKKGNPSYTIQIRN